MDAGLAKVINSTVGTANVKSLDEILNSGKSIVASSELYQSFPTNLRALSNITTNAEKEICSFTMPLDGSVHLSFRIGFQSTSNDNSAFLKLYKNGAVHSTNTYPGKMISDAEALSVWKALTAGKSEHRAFEALG